MKTKTSKTVFGQVRKTVSMDCVLEKHIQNFADEKYRGDFSYMSYMLLKSAVSERLRKKGVKYEDDCS